MIKVSVDMLKAVYLYKTKTSNMTDAELVKSIIELHEASKWVKFDVNDESTYPIVPDGYVNIEVNVYDTVNNNINHDYFHPDYGFNHYQHHVTHWQYLPEFKE